MTKQEAMERFSSGTVQQSLEIHRWNSVDRSYHRSIGLCLNCKIYALRLG